MGYVVDEPFFRVSAGLKSAFMQSNFIANVVDIENLVEINAAPIVAAVGDESKKMQEEQAAIVARKKKALTPEV